MASPTRKFTTTTTGEVNQPPVAVLATQKIDALIGSIIQLDGRKSRDPENQPLTWHWSFTQVPLGSEVEIAGFGELRPKGSAVSFAPDKTGIYVVQLVVNDGELDSAPVTATVNIQYSRVPCGENIVPDAHFLWDYISNFWNLVSDREKITTVWSSVIQLIGADMLKLWGADLNKAIGTIQSTFQRRWQNISAITDVYSEFDQRIILGKTDSGTGASTGLIGEIAGAGNTQVVYMPLGPVGGITETDFTNLAGNYGAKGRVIVVNGEGYTIQRVSNENLVLASGSNLAASGISVQSSGAAFVTAGVLVGHSVLILSGTDQGEYLVTNVVSDTELEVSHIDGSTPTLSSTDSRFEAVIKYSVAVVDEEAIPDGQKDVPWSIPNLLHIPSVNFEENGVRVGDVLVFEVTRKDTNLSVELRAQVVGVDRTRLGFEFTLDDLEDGTENVSRDLIGQLVLDLNLIPLDSADSTTSAAAEALISFMPVGVNLNTRPFSSFQITFRAKKIIHNTELVVDADLVSIPALQEYPKDPPVVLRENLDYVVEDGSIVFISDLFSPTEPAPELLWAECAIYDNAEIVEGNFGRLVGLTRDDLTAKRTRAPYLSAVRGLMFAFTNGPTVANVRLGLQILLGLPFTEERGVIIDIRENYSTATDGSALGRILVEDVDDRDRMAGIRRVYYYPMIVGLEDNPATGESYKEDDIVERFAPLSKGVEVQDYIKTPRWWVYAFSGLEILKYFRFKAAIDSDVFDSNDVAFAIEFVRTMRPYYTDVISSAVANIVDDIEIEDVFQIDLIAPLYSNPWSLESTIRPSDIKHGVTLWGFGPKPLHVRIPRILWDVQTYKDGSDVIAYSETGWSTDDVLARRTFTDYRIEGDILVILRGQPGASLFTNGMYEIIEVVDANTLKLGYAAPTADPLTFDNTLLDPDLFEYGENLVCSIVRREWNPLVYGVDLETNSSDNIVTSATARFISNNATIGDHLQIEDGSDIGEYIIDAVTAAVTSPFAPPLIEETRVRLLNLDGSTPSFSDATGVTFFVVRPSLQNRVLSVGCRCRKYPSGIQLQSQDTADGYRQWFSFTRGMIGSMVNVSNSQNPANDGDFMVTDYTGPGLVETDSPSTVTDSSRGTVIHLADERPGSFERISDVTPVGICEFALHGDQTGPCLNMLQVTGINQLAVDGAYTPQGTPANPYTLEGPANTGSNPVQLGFKKGDRIRLLATASGSPQNLGAEVTLVDPAALTVFEDLTTPDTAVYEFEVIRRMSV